MKFQIVLEDSLQVPEPLCSLTSDEYIRGDTHKCSHTSAGGLPGSLVPGKCLRRHGRDVEKRSL